MNFQAPPQVSGKVGTGTTLRSVEPTHYAEQSHRVHTLLHGPRVRGGTPDGHRLWQPEGSSLHKEGNQVALEDATDQLDEARGVALLHSAKYQQAMRRYHERNIRSQEFQVGDLVLRRIQSNQGRHKLSPPWEGPFM